MATIAHLKNGKYKAIVKKNGKILKTKTFSKKSLARTWAKRIETDQELLTALGVSGSKLTVKELAKEYRDGNTRLEWLVNQIGPTKPIYEITVEDVRSCLDKFYNTKSPTTKKLRSPATFNRAKALLSGMFRFAINKGYLASNPVKGITSKPENNKRIRYLSDEERTNLLQACKNSSWDKLELIVTMAMVTGMRRGELVKLKWSDIDFNIGTACLKTTKNGEPRIVPIPRVALDMLKTYRVVGNEYIFKSEKVNKPFVFQKHWLKCLEESGVENFRFHDLRHDAASTLARAGATLLEIGVILGHKSVQTTQRYAHLSIDSQKGLSDRVFKDLIRDKEA